MSITYYGNRFNRTTPDPFRNYSGITQFTTNGYTDLDRRVSDRGTRYISDLGDSYPGTVILKSTPSLLSPAPGPNSKRTGISVEDARCCQIIEEEKDQACIDREVDFLNDLPSPEEYREELNEQANGCSAIELRLCNYFVVRVYHEYVVEHVCLPGGGGSTDVGVVGKCCSIIYDWCETIVFSTCTAKNVFAQYVKTQRCIDKYSKATVGEPAITHYDSTSCTEDYDETCIDDGCALDPDNVKPVAYTSGPRSTSGGNCGEGAKKLEATEDSAWVKYSC